MSKVAVLILAAGEGTRMKSARPKVLHEVAGRALVEHVLDASSTLKGAAAGLVVGRGADEVKRLLAGRDLSYFLQKERRGSGHAVATARAWLSRRGGDVVVLCGDAPLLRPETIKDLFAFHKKEGRAATVLTARVADPAGYGRIVRDAGGRVRAIVEEKDASPAQRAVDEINSGTYAFRVPDLLWALSRIKADNAKGEYYITDAVGLLAGDGRPVGGLCVEGGEECLGVNTRVELAAAGKILHRRIAERLMREGVTLVDPDATYIDAGVRVGPDTVIEPQTILRGETRVGAGCRLGPWTLLEDCVVADGARVAGSFAQDAVIGPDASVGPFARLRSGATLGKGVKVGNFVEIKKSVLAEGVKAGHLAYLGDASVGADANIGAGAITCNYDGFSKNKTVIGAGAFIGSNVNLVAPVKVGRGAVIGAGSTITESVPADALGLERARQISKPGWAARRRKNAPKRNSHG